MTQTITIRQGITEPQSFAFRQTDPDSGAVTNVDITGYGSVSLFLRAVQGGGTPVELTTGDSDITIADASPAEGEAHGSFVFAEGDLTPGDYHGYFLVVDATDARIYFPSDDIIKFKVLPRFAHDD